MEARDWNRIKEIFAECLEADADSRKGILEGVEAELRGEVEQLLANYKAAAEFIDQPAAVEYGASELSTDRTIGTRIDDYLIVDRIGTGGMGSVYLAEQQGDNLHHRVALKLIKRGMDTDMVLRRFVQERQILADLEHPNIARFLDGGSTTDGLPYFVMEYVEGLPIRKFADENSFDLRQRLDLFRKVCGAVSFAHQNLIVHRDLKQSNILVSRDGEPKLLDFGIAKLLNSDRSTDPTDATATMFRVMTPEYASPEQVRGEVVTTSSDVYSLGVILYELLTGQRPYNYESNSADDAARQMQQLEPMRPSSVVANRTFSRNATGGIEAQDTANKNTGVDTSSSRSRALRGDLDNIILKALQKERERRYASVQEFSEDIRRHLDGLPVMATAATVSYRAAKFIRRHRAGVAAGSLVAILLFAATGITASQAYRADRERTRAEQRFFQVRKLANSLLFDYHDGIEKLAGATPVREKMVRDALEYLDNLSAEGGGDTELQRELAAAYQKVGDVQGSPQRSNLGNSKGSLESYQKALAIREELHADAAANDQIKLDLIQSYTAVGELSQVTGKLPEALENYRKAFDIYATLDESTKSRQALAVLFRHAARALERSGKMAEAIENFNRSIAVLNDLLTADPDNASFKRDLGLAYVFLGEAFVGSMDLKGALSAERTAYDLLGSLTSPNNAQSRREANLAYSRIARILGRMGDKKGALETALKSLAIDEELLKADPSNSLARRDAAISYYKVAQSYVATGDIKASIPNYRKAVELCEADISSNPLRSELRGDLVAYLYWLGEALEKNSDMAEALETHKKVLAMQQTLADEDPTSSLQRGNLAIGLTKVGNMSLRFGNRLEALQYFQKAMATREQLVAGDPEYAVGRGQLAFIYKGLGDYYASVGDSERNPNDWQEAKYWYQKSLGIWTELQNKNPLEAEDAKEPGELMQKIRKCESALSKA